MFGVKKGKKLKADDSILAIDIGTEFVKVALFEVESGDAVVYGYSRKRQHNTSMQNAVIVSLADVTDIVDLAVGEAISEASALAERAFYPGKAIVGIAGELVRGVQIEVEVDREEPNEPISKQEIDGILENVAEYTFSNTVNEISEEIGVPSKDIRELDMAINSIYVNGNKSISPLGLTGSKLLYKVFSTFAPLTHYNAIVSVVRNLNLSLEKIVVEPYALAVGVEDMQKVDRSGIFIDIGGGTTDVAIVKNGDVVGTKMFSIGGRALTKKIQEAFSVDYIAAEQLKVDYSLNKLNPADTKKLRESIKTDIEIWLEGVEIALSEFDEMKELPPRFFLCGGGALLTDVRTSIIEYPWTQVLPFKTFPRVELLLPNKIENVVDLTKSAIDPIDVMPLALARMALD